MRGGRVDPDSGAPGYDGRAGGGRPGPVLLPARRRPAAASRAARRRPAAVHRRRAPASRGCRCSATTTGSSRAVTPPTPALNDAATGGFALRDVDARAALREVGPDTTDAAAIDRVISGGLPGTRVAVPRGPRRGGCCHAQEVVTRLRDAARVPGTGGPAAVRRRPRPEGPAARPRHRGRPGRHRVADRAAAARRATGGCIVASHQPLPDARPRRAGDAPAGRRDAQRPHAPHEHRAVTARQARAGSGASSRRRWPTAPAGPDDLGCARARTAAS